MRLEDVSAQLRPRAPWESVDLGFAMVRRHMRLLLMAWGLTVVPLWCLLGVSTHWIPLGWVMLIIWWLKPIYDRVPLFILSRSLFGATPRLRDVLRAWPGLLFRDFFRLMLLRVPWLIAVPQFSWARSLLMPLVDLEQQRGASFSARQTVLLRQAGSTATGLVIFCALYESVLLFALLTIGVSIMSDPLGASGFWQAMAEMIVRHGEMPAWLTWSLIAAYLLAMTFVEIFFVGGGFGLYLNCRTHLEGWDVEIVFRRLADRLAKAVSIFAVLALFLCGQASARERKTVPDADEYLSRPTKLRPAPRYDIESPVNEKQAIDEVLRHKDFEVHVDKGYHWVSESSPSSPNLSGDWSLLGALAQGLYYLIIVAFIAFIAWLIWKCLPLFSLRSGALPEVRAGPRTLMGMDITPDSLPDDIVAAARERWKAGDVRGALSLLYRGSLAWLVHVARLGIAESDTEGDCLRHVGELPETQRRDYFSVLTNQWVSLAYGGHDPGASDMERLLANWPFVAEKERRAT
jgi:hypothetical protein